LSQRFRKASHVDQPAWVRVEMDSATAKFVSELDLSEANVLEVGGRNWQSLECKAYESVDYPEYDLCHSPYRKEAFDLILLEQVMEHVLWPFRAAKHVHQMLRPGGWVVVTTPFLVKIHAYPVDCCRWTPLGMKHLLAEGGFCLDQITAESWGNRDAVIGGFSKVPSYRKWLHSLRNEPNFPVMVWAFAQKSLPVSHV